MFVIILYGTHFAILNRIYQLIIYIQTTTVRRYMHIHCRRLPRCPLFHTLQCYLTSDFNKNFFHIVTTGFKFPTIRLPPPLQQTTSELW